MESIYTRDRGYKTIVVYNLAHFINCRLGRWWDCHVYQTGLLLCFILLNIIQFDQMSWIHLVMDDQWRTNYSWRTDLSTAAVKNLLVRTILWDIHIAVGNTNDKWLIKIKYLISGVLVSHIPVKSKWNFISVFHSFFYYMLIFTFINLGNILLVWSGGTAIIM